MKLQTIVQTGPMDISLSRKDTVAVLGSCLADNLGAKFVQGGFRTCVNPFGALYNPLSLLSAVRRLSDASPFTEAECVEMGAGAGLVCSFSHHTSFAREKAEDFLAVANESLAVNAQLWQDATKVVLVLGTVYCYSREGSVVTNCLKRPAAEFERFRLSLEDTVDALRAIVEPFPGKEFILCVCPIRHLSDGAPANALSKSTLLLAADRICAEFANCRYFPAFEIMMDELRDYRFYAEDMAHLTPLAEQILWERLLDSCCPASERDSISASERAFRATQHRKLH